jgi:hypothetical protein
MSGSDPDSDPDDMVLFEPFDPFDLKDNIVITVFEEPVIPIMKPPPPIVKRCYHCCRVRCQHNYRKFRCEYCNVKLCIHGHFRDHCADCLGEVCEHMRFKDNCPVCPK